MGFANGIQETDGNMQVDINADSRKTISKILYLEL